MSGFIQYLGSSTANIETGVVVGILGGEKYKVRIKDKDTILQSAMNDPLFVGDRVVLNRTQYNRFIVGTTKRVRSEIDTEEVVVDG